MGDIEFLEAAREYRREEERTKCPDCGVSFGLHHVDCPLKEDESDVPILNNEGI